MKKLLTYIIILNFSFCYGQNLVPNGDFETYTDCPTTQGLLPYASPWSNIASLTPDYYHTCSSDLQSDVPTNLTGYQIPHSGNGYVGIFAFQVSSSPNVREYISIQLEETLQNEQEYHLQFYLSLSNNSQFAITTIGAYFSESDALPMNQFILNVTPQIVNSTQALTDTTSWTLITGTYIATGGEQYLTIGNFEDDDNSGLQQVNGGISNSAYYYIDDVCVSNDSLSCLIPTSIYDRHETNEFNIYPNPTTGHVIIKAEEVESIEIINIDGRIVYSGKETELDLSMHPNGIYFIKVITDKQTVTKKLIKQ